MARQKLSEYRTKVLLARQLEGNYQGVQVSPQVPFNSTQFDSKSSLVVKVDQGIKKRGKQGLVKTKLSPTDIPEIVKQWQELSYNSFIVEPMIAHKQADEHYLSLQRTADGILLSFNEHGGINVEEYGEDITSHLLVEENFLEIAELTDLDPEILRQLILFFNRHHFSFLEINPYLLIDGQFVALDAAAYVDGAAHFLAAGSWDENDFRQYHTKSDEEIFVDQLASSSQASFKYEIINPNGSIFMLLSGGGASIVLADEVFNQGAGEQLANYGEYSGNPNREETFLYTSAILRSLLKSNATNKKLILAGGVANFTDIRATFEGVIRALDEHAEALREQSVKVYVRRGGPHEAEALETMRIFLESQDLFGSVSGHDALITSPIGEALKPEAA